MTEVLKRGRGRPRLSLEEKALRKAERDAMKQKVPCMPVLSEDELFQLLVDHEPRIRAADLAREAAAARAHDERRILAKAFGSMALARRKLDLFRRAQTDEGQAEANALIEMRERRSKASHLGEAADASQAGLL